MRTARTFRARSNTQGAYRILLTPGYYTVTTVERIGWPATSPGPSTSAPPIDQLDFAIGTGILAPALRRCLTHAIALFVPAR
jgi:hypothetical protein